VRRNAFPQITVKMMDKEASTMELPGLLAEVEGIVGRDAAIKFAIACGGTRIYIPARLSDEHWLVESIGLDAARKLAKHFTFQRRGLRLDVPMMPRAIQTNELTTAGASSREIALQLGIHQRTVHRHRSKMRDDKEQR
jgi:DNA-binding NarL/FixJ family response regulator